jgi:hypothetical protein
MDICPATACSLKAIGSAFDDSKSLQEGVQADTVSNDDSAANKASAAGTSGYTVSNDDSAANKASAAGTSGYLTRAHH